MSRIGLALGSGGARGLAHIPILEEFDRAGVKPSAIAGTSIGAIIGAMYAAGRSGAFIRKFADEHIPGSEESLLEAMDLGVASIQEFLTIQKQELTEKKHEVAG